MFNNAVTRLWENWALIKQHWLTFLAVVVVAVGATWGFSKLFYGQQIAEQQTHIGLLQGRLDRSATAAPASQWTLTDEETGKLAVAISGHHFKPIMMVAKSESRGLAKQLATVMRNSGTNVYPSELDPHVIIPIGVWIAVTDFLSPPKDALDMQIIFQKADMTVGIYSGLGAFRSDEASFFITIGGQPW